MSNPRACVSFSLSFSFHFSFLILKISDGSIKLAEIGRAISSLDTYSYVVNGTELGNCPVLHWEATRVYPTVPMLGSVKVNWGKCVSRELYFRHRNSAGGLIVADGFLSRVAAKMRILLAMRVYRNKDPYGWWSNAYYISDGI